MKFRLAILAVAVAATACSSVNPVPVRAGDVCFRCRRAVDEPKLAAEIVSGGGLAFKFKTAGCLATYLRQNPAESGTIFVTDYATGRMLKATSATFVPVTLGTGSQQTQDFLAFQATADARAAAEQEGTTTTNWAGVLASGN